MAQKEPPNPFPTLPPYRPPQHGLLSFSPSSWVPYAELIRLTRPIGILLIYSPYLFGSLFAAAVTSSDPPSSLDTLLKTNVVLLFGTVLLRGSAVAFNDFADREIDGKVARTRHRPLARKAVSPINCLFFVAAQAILWLVVLMQLSLTCVLYAVPYLGLVGLYPYSKRVTDLTPVVLGFTIGYGIFIGSVAMGLDPVAMVLDGAMRRVCALCCIYLSCAIWTIIYETIYAHQDIQNDEKQGVRSTAVCLKGRAKPVLYLLAVLQVMLLTFSGLLIDAGPVYFIGACLGAAFSLGFMIWSVDLGKPSECWWWFLNNTWFVGGSIVPGLLSQIWAKDREGMPSLRLFMQPPTRCCGKDITSGVLKESLKEDMNRKVEINIYTKSFRFRPFSSRPTLHYNDLCIVLEQIPSLLCLSSNIISKQPPRKDGIGERIRVALEGFVLQKLTIMFSFEQVHRACH